MSAVRLRAAPTPRDLAVLAFVRAQVVALEPPPTRAEIARRFSFSRPPAEGHLQALAQHGLLLLERRWRGIVVTPQGALS